MSDTNDYSKLLFFDTETVAISPKYIISIAYILYENGKRKDYGYVICNPDYPISPGASRVNGFTNENVANKPLFNEIWPDIKEYFEDSVWIGHNSKFDEDALALEFSRYNIEMPHHYSLDTCAIAKKMLKKPIEVENHKLMTLCKHFGHNFDGYHQASVDTVACQKIYNDLIKLNKERNYAYDNLFVPIEVNKRIKEED